MKLERYSRDLEVQAEVLGRVCKDLQMGLHRLDVRILQEKTAREEREDKNLHKEVLPNGVDISAVDELLEKAKKVMTEPIEKAASKKKLPGKSEERPSKVSGRPSSQPKLNSQIKPNSQPKPKPQSSKASSLKINVSDRNKKYSTKNTKKKQEPMANQSSSVPPPQQPQPNEEAAQLVKADDPVCS